MWNFYIGVDDIDRAAEAVKPAAGRSSTARWKSRAANMQSIAVDPQGALFGLVGPRKQ